MIWRGKAHMTFRLYTPTVATMRQVLWRNPALLIWTTDVLWQRFDVTEDVFGLERMLCLRTAQRASFRQWAGYEGSRG